MAIRRVNYLDKTTGLGFGYDTATGDVVLVIGKQTPSVLLRLGTGDGAAGRVLCGDGTSLVSQALGGDATIGSDGSLTFGAAAVEASMLGANLRTGFIPLDIFTARIISSDAIQNTTEGGVPDGNTAPSIARVNGATDKQGRLVWASSSSIEVQLAPFAYPPDLDDTAAVSVHVLAAMAGETDTPTITVGYFEGVGDTDAGGETAALSDTLADVSVAIAAGDVGAHPKSASVTLTPGAHTTDALHMYAAWAEYTRKS